MILGKMKEKENKNRYFYVDYGKDTSDEMLLMIEITVGALKLTENFHVVTYVTDQPHSFYVQEITEDEFLEHHRKEDIELK